MEFTYGGKTFNVAWGMLFQKAFWDVALNHGEGFNGVELLVTVMFEGNKAYHNLNGGAKAFDSKRDVYKLIDESNDPEAEAVIIAAFMETQTYQSILDVSKAVEEDKKK